ncbi:response regulator transcription factor [Marinicella sp. S1101]|uniref:LytR/AlgR family response regulator transcription factor n=1 Tax=Marinicella marina TaxID=2996016 RepID=UPI002260CE86|nr:response regulator transcription factor [Marinicella marina]MCX7553654.1 response regulator transcription factor [Marinicella marina]MDJ1140278.1 response regulator transcription factor [Marinicella marina]
MSIKCLIVDDEKLGRELIATHLKQLPECELIGSCASAIEASQFLQENSIDLIFLDIEMPVLKGTDFYQGLSHKPAVIFTTAYRQYAVDGFELEAVDYLLKPITFARFFKAMERFKKTLYQSVPTSIDTTASKHIFIRANRKQIKLQLDDITHIQALKDYLQIHTTNGTHITKDTMKSFLQSLPPEFLQIHRSYIVNKNHVTAFTSHDVELNKIEIPIGETFQNHIKTQLQ